MTRWLIGGTMLLAGLAALACVGLTRSGPEIVVDAAVTPEPAPPAPPRPAEPELPRVVDVADIDPLLDPPPPPAAAGPAPVLTAVGYEEPAAPVPPAGAVPPIPPAAQDEPAAAASPGDSDPSYRVRDAGAVPAALDQLPFGTIHWTCVGDWLKAHPLTLGELPVASVRSGWYGDGWGRIEGKVADFWAEWVPFPPGFVTASPAYPTPPGGHGVGVGVGLFF